MALDQALKSVRRILRNPYVQRGPALLRYIAWQRRRLARQFPVELPLSRSVLIARSGHCGVSALVNVHGLYDYDNMTLLQELLAQGGTFLDVGANIGSYTLVAAEQHEACVLAVEAHPITARYLLENVQRNGMRNVRVVCAAVGASEGSVIITDTPGSATTHISDAGICVPLRRLDALLGELEFTPQLMKIDVEGSELDVLRGMGERLSEVQLVFVEINELGEQRGAGAGRLLEFLRSAGFEGPRYCDARRRCLGQRRILPGEDPVFVRPRFRDVLQRQHGMRFES